MKSPAAAALCGDVDLVMTSPPYVALENYDVDCPNQSANRYRDYERWRTGFYRPLIEGAYQLLKPGGVFVLNVADAGSYPLEHDALLLFEEVGFKREHYFKLAMNVTPGTKATRLRHWVQVDGVAWKFEPVMVFRKPMTNG